MCFLTRVERPTLAVLTHGVDGAKLKTYEVLPKDLVIPAQPRKYLADEKGLLDGPWQQTGLSESFTHLIPLPAGGCLLAGSDALIYFPGRTGYEARQRKLHGDSLICSWTPLDTRGTRFLLATASGPLIHLNLTYTPEHMVSNIHTHLQNFIVLV